MQLTYSDRKKTSGQKGDEEWISKGYKTTFRVEGYIYYLIVVMISWAHQIVHFRYVQFMSITSR